MGLSATIAKQASNQGLRFMWFGNYRDWITNNGGSAWELQAQMSRRDRRPGIELCPGGWVAYARL